MLGCVTDLRQMPVARSEHPANVDSMSHASTTPVRLSSLKLISSSSLNGRRTYASRIFDTEQLKKGLDQ